MSIPPLMFEWAEYVGKTIRQKRGLGLRGRIMYFVATDTPDVVVMARERFGTAQVLSTIGDPEIPLHSKAGRLKAIQDLWLLSQSDGMILSRTSSFADKALALAMHTMVTIRCRPNWEWIAFGKNLKPFKRVKLAVDVPDWTCAHVMLQDGKDSEAGMSLQDNTAGPLYARMKAQMEVTHHDITPVTV